MNPELLLNERDKLRDTWRDIRTKRLELKNILAAKDVSVNDIRHNKDYRILKKEQKHISKMIKHIENKIYREIKNEA
jgi:hypothetical protein